MLHRSRFILLALTALLITIPIASCTDARAEEVKVKSPRVGVLAVGDTLKVTVWFKAANADSVTVDVTTLAPAHGTKHAVIPNPTATNNTAVINFIPVPALVDGEVVTVHACFRAFHLTVASAIVCRDAPPYTQPVTPPTVTPDSVRAVGMLLDPPLDSIANVHAPIGSVFTFCTIWVYADSGVALRSVDQTPQCLGRLTAMYAANRIKLNSGLRQLVTDSQCVDWDLAGGNNGRNGTITPSSFCDRICDTDFTPKQCVVVNTGGGLFRMPPRDQLNIPVLRRA